MTKMGTSNKSELDTDVSSDFVNKNFSLIQTSYKLASNTLKTIC